MDDVVGHVMFAGRDEDLLAGDFIDAVARRHGLGAQETEIGAAMRLGQVHGAGPCTFHHLRQPRRLLLVGAMREDRRDRALGEAGIHQERHVGRRHIFADGAVQRIGQALAAMLGRHGQPHPSALAILAKRLLETGGRGHRTVVVAGASFSVAGAVGRLDHFLGQPRAFGQDRLDHVGRGVGETGKVGVPLDAQNLVEDEKRVPDGSLVSRHRYPPARNAGSAFNAGPRIDLRLGYQILTFA